ncbi:MAG: hypothetical protein ACI9EF_002675 [Pseudohongiellaceae bacterium]|jgi:hypothetical protein
MTVASFWTFVRKDIGRKLTAVGLAVGVWFWLAQNLAGEMGVVLEMRVVETRREAEDAQVGVPALYVVKPHEFILLQGDAVEAKVLVRGLKTDLDKLQLSAVFEISPDVLGTQAEGSFRLQLTNPANFRALGAAIDDLDISVSPPWIDLRLAREDRMTLDLGPRNVHITGVLKPGHVVDKSLAVVSPSQVEIIGPSHNIAAIRDDPSLLAFEVINLENQAYTVSREVSLDREKVDRSVRLALLDSVTVRVPIKEDDIVRQLYSVPVLYENVEDLERRGMKIVDKTDFVDLQVVGPKTLLDASAYSDEVLATKIWLVFDWANAGVRVANMDVVTPHLLPGTVRIEALNGGAPQIKYELEVIATNPTPNVTGDSP